MITKLHKFPPHHDADIGVLLECLLNKLDVEDLIFLIRLFQRTPQAKYLIARKIKKIINKKLS
ncbi:hypothetical protein [Avibacterium paragallinarum]|uniref:hypothetical protein n=1 Tax=Avibacterium paragallinarum TaxID=728 RepID=UPI00397B575B